MVLPVVRVVEYPLLMLVFKLVAQATLHLQAQVKVIMEAVDITQAMFRELVVVVLAQ